MQITFSPVRRDGRPSIEVLGEALIIDGETFDFSAIPEGATLPAEAVASDWINGPVERIGGELHLTLLLSHGANAPTATLFPAAMTPTDGPIALPAYEEPTQ
ncbi:MAG: hypothetical protein KI788_14140 [Mameliella sp.]|nr:hypothetical protein [Mameliella sp.]